MLLLIHQHAEKPVRVLCNGEEVEVKETDLSKLFWKLAEEYPEEIITWCEEELIDDLNAEAWSEIFHHDLIMASYGIKTDFLSDKIGYIDQFPFVNVNREVQIGTWRMSTDVGGIKGRALLQFRAMLGQIRDFGFLLNSIGKLGQQNGLFCYSAPMLIKGTRKDISNQGLRPLPSGQAQPDILSPSPLVQAQSELVRSGNKEGLPFGRYALRTGSFDSRSRQAPQPYNVEGLKSTASTKELFSFVYAHYKSIRLWLFFWCFVRYEKSFPIGALIAAFFQKKYFKKDIDLSEIELRSNRAGNPGTSIDVIIPTLGRKQYLLQVLADLKVQSLLPKKVIVVEQNPDPGSQSELPELKTQTWPFEIVHHFTHKTGACHARNLALEKVDAEWLFFADDDIKLEEDLLEKGLDELKRLGADCLNINCKQEGENTVFYKIKQWGSFGSGTSLVNAGYCNGLRFDEVFEFGFGEDQDYGMQLRHAGCDIIYHPEIEILHLKAPRGGFRELSLPPWEKDKPKPSPTIMIYAKKYFTQEQQKGYKTELFLRFYPKQDIKNPLKYLKGMEEGWRKSEAWAENLQNDRFQKEMITSG